MKTYFDNNLKRAQFVIETEGDEEDYQTGMLCNNRIRGVLQTGVCHVDGRNYYQYDVSGMICLEKKYEKEKLSYEDIQRLVQDLLSVLQETRKYMLDGKGILLDPQYIFCDRSHFLFCYFPPNDKKITEEFHHLTEFLVREVDYRDEKGVHLAYTLHKATMEEHYSIEQIMSEFGKEEEPHIIKYEDRMPEETMEVAEIAEEPEFWEPVRRLLERKKTEKWGYWDEINIEEDDL